MWKKGISGNSKGKVKGTKNKFTTEMRAHIENLLTKTNAQAELDYLELAPKDRWQVRLILMEFVTPKLARMEYTQEVAQAPQITVSAMPAPLALAAPEQTDTTNSELKELLRSLSKEEQSQILEILKAKEVKKPSPNQKNNYEDFKEDRKDWFSKLNAKKEGNAE